MLLSQPNWWKPTCILREINLSQIKVGKFLLCFSLWNELVSITGPSCPIAGRPPRLEPVNLSFSAPQPHLHKIVNSSMELAQTAKEPYNYFLLLRALFRSIGGGSHDLLYQEFLPLLPNLLQGQSSKFGCLLVCYACMGLAALGAGVHLVYPVRIMGRGHVCLSTAVCVCPRVLLSLKALGLSRNGFFLPTQSWVGVAGFSYPG